MKKVVMATMIMILVLSCSSLWAQDKAKQGKPGRAETAEEQLDRIIGIFDADKKARQEDGKALMDATKMMLGVNNNFDSDPNKIIVDKQKQSLTYRGEKIFCTDTKIIADAGNGNPEAQLKAGMCYAWYYGNKDKAMDWYTKAFNNNKADGTELEKRIIGEIENFIENNMAEKVNSRIYGGDWWKELTTLEHTEFSFDPLNQAKSKQTGAEWKLYRAALAQGVKLRHGKSLCIRGGELIREKKLNAVRSLLGKNFMSLLPQNDDSAKEGIKMCQEAAAMGEPCGWDNIGSAIYAGAGGETKDFGKASEAWLKAGNYVPALVHRAEAALKENISLEKELREAEKLSCQGEGDVVWGQSATGVRTGIASQRSVFQAQWCRRVRGNLELMGRAAKKNPGKAAAAGIITEEAKW